VKVDVKEQQNVRKEKQDNPNKTCTNAMQVQEGNGMRYTAVL
jgi:hypothetical protein